MLELDHLVLVGKTLEEAVAAAEDVLGVPLDAGGQHDRMGTHNRVLSLGSGVYFEAIASDPDGKRPAHPRWYNIDAFAGPPVLTHWAARTNDIASTLAVSPDGTGEPVDFTRGDYAWTMAVPESGQLPFAGMSPAILQWTGRAHPARELPDRGCRFRHLEVAHPDVEQLLATFPGLQEIEGVTFTSGQEPALRAEIATPHGLRVIE